MRFKGLVIFSLVVFSIFSLSYAYGPRFSVNLTNNLQLTKISGTVTKIENRPALTITVKTGIGEKEVLLGPAWLQIKELKVGSKIEVEGFESPVSKIFKAVKVTVDGKEVLNSLTQNRGYTGRRMLGFRNFQNCPCLNLQNR